MYYRRDTLLAAYIGDLILTAKTEKLIKAAVKEIAENFEKRDEGEKMNTWE